MENVLARFKAVESKLKAKPWFKSGKWLISAHGFPASNPDGVTLHVYKKHWFNEDKQGIHFESYLALELKKQKKSYVTLHLLHEPLVPGTNIKRMELSKPIIDEVRGEVESWDGYEFRAGAYGVQPFTKKIDGTSEDFEKLLEAELSRLCQAVGGVIDSHLKQLSLRE